LEAVPERLALGYLAGESTLFRGVNKLLPGHWLIWNDGQLTTEQYWEIPRPPMNPEDADEEE
jgi:asparagine synthase (glutamine-hydrolysing)